MSSDPINIDELNEIMNSDKQLIKECFQDFSIDFPDIMAQLKAAVDAEDFKEIDDGAHKLKGVLSYLAAGPAVQAAATLEQAGRNKIDEGLTDKFTDLETQCSLVLEFINNFN